MHRCSGCKKEDHGKYSSVNDGISSELCSLLCTSVDDISRVIAALGRGTLLAKVDVKSAYRIVPIHLEDRPLLHGHAVEWPPVY